jgi:hypothetical protein
MRLAWPPPFDAGPLLGPPAGDLGVVALGGAAGGPLRAPVMPAQQPPHVPGVVADAGEPPDHLGDPRQGPQVGVEPVGFRPLQQGAFHPPPVRLREPRGAAPAARTGQPGAAALAPAGVPAAGRLAGDPKPAGDLGLGQALGEQAGGLQAALPSGCGAQGRDAGGVDGVGLAMTIASLHAKPAKSPHSTSLCSSQETGKETKAMTPTADRVVHE